MALLLAISGAFATNALANAQAAPTVVREGDVIQVQDMRLTMPEGWTLKQNAKDAGVIILGLQKGEQYVTLYVKGSTGLDMRGMFASNGATVVRDMRGEDFGGRNWKVLETKKTFSAHNKTYYVASFLAEHDGNSYYGFSRSPTSSDAAKANVDAVLEALR